MKRLPVIAILALCFGCNNADEQSTMKETHITIKTVDDTGTPFRIQTVRWWYSGKRNQKHELKCETRPCSEWVIEEKTTGPIVIHADASVVKENDDQCWDLYAGEIVVEMPVKDVTVTMTYANMVCK